MAQQFYAEGSLFDGNGFTKHSFEEPHFINTKTYVWGGVQELKQHVNLGYTLPKVVPNLSPFDYDCVRRKNSLFLQLQHQKNVVLNFQTMAGLVSFEKFSNNTKHVMYVNPSEFLLNTNLYKAPKGQVMMMGENLILENDLLGVSSLEAAGRGKNVFLLSKTSQRSLQYTQEPLFKLFYWVNGELTIRVPKIAQHTKRKLVEVSEKGWMGLTKTIKAENFWHLCAKLIIK